MTRKKGDLNPSRYCCYVYDSSQVGPEYQGVKFGKAIAYKEFANAAAAEKYLNAPTRLLLPRVLSTKIYRLDVGCYMGNGGGQWQANQKATVI